VPLRIYNTKTRAKEEFQPLHPPAVRMYVCGITVYDYCHLGHARAAVVFDIVYRYLKYKGYQVQYVRNFTDIDDKIIKRSQETGMDWRELTAKFIQAFHEDMMALGNLKPTQEPKATDYIEGMQAMIAKLVEKGLAYQGGGDVFFSIKKFPSYGELAHKKIEELAVGARVEVDEDKIDPLDFALWKGAKPGEPKWPSRWGEGRPGWHIECSTMSTQLLGNTLDIHGGGRDLTFPHHENERAQSEGATGQPFVRFWIHNGFVNLNADKMSKSTGNFLTIRDVLRQFPFEAVRYFLLASHYRSPLDFTDQNIRDAQAAVDRVYQTLERLSKYSPVEGKGCSDSVLKDLDGQLSRFANSFTEAMDDDFNTAQVLGYTFDLIRELNRFLDQQPAPAQFSTRKAKIEECFKPLCETLGLFGQDPRAYFQFQRERVLKQGAMNDAEIQQKIDERKQARVGRDFAQADRIRAELAERGIILKDNPDGSTSWMVK
jgi:cysteinyl-tRNA synthetase